MRGAINACVRGVARGLEALAEREAAMLRTVQYERVAMLRVVKEEREAALQVSLRA